MTDDKKNKELLEAIKLKREILRKRELLRASSVPADVSKQKPGVVPKDESLMQTLKALGPVAKKVGLGMLPDPYGVIPQEEPLKGSDITMTAGLGVQALADAIPDKMKFATLARIGAAAGLGGLTSAVHGIVQGSEEGNTPDWKQSLANFGEGALYAGFGQGVGEGFAKALGPKKPFAKDYDPELASAAKLHGIESIASEVSSATPIQRTELWLARQIGSGGAYSKFFKNRYATVKNMWENVAKKIGDVLPPEELGARVQEILRKRKIEFLGGEVPTPPGSIMETMHSPGLVSKSYENLWNGTGSIKIEHNKLQQVSQEIYDKIVKSASEGLKRPQDTLDSFVLEQATKPPFTSRSLRDAHELHSNITDVVFSSSASASTKKLYAAKLSRALNEDIHKSLSRYPALLQTYKTIQKNAHEAIGAFENELLRGIARKNPIQVPYLFLKEVSSGPVKIVDPDKVRMMKALLDKEPQTWQSIKASFIDWAAKQGNDIRESDAIIKGIGHEYINSKPISNILDSLGEAKNLMYTKDELKGIENAMKITQTHQTGRIRPEYAGSNMMQGLAIRATSGMVGGGFAGYGLGLDPAMGATLGLGMMTLGPAILAKMALSKTGRALLTEGTKGTLIRGPRSRAVSNLAFRTAAYLKRPEFDNDIKQLQQLMGVSNDKVNGPMKEQ